jgi:thioesterase domain-containing protein
VLRRGWQCDVTLARFVERESAGPRRAVFGPLQWLGGYSSLRNATAIGSAHFIDVTCSTPPEILSVFAAQRIQTIVASGSVIKLLAGAARVHGRIPAPLTVSCVGERLTPAVIAAAREIGTGPVTVRSIYGASEVLAGYMYILEAHEEIPTGAICLGNPITDAAEFVPVEHFGAEEGGGLHELVVRRWVSQGYLGDSDLNESRFGVNPEGDPLWRSGDLMRRGDDGLWYHAGRIDDMIKIAGKSVEPAEAERAISRYPGVLNAVVLPRHLEGERPQLTAHVQVSGSVTSDALRAHLTEELPAHLIPAVISRHDILPVNKQGKVDRQLLTTSVPVPWRSRPLVEPRTATEQLVVAEASRYLEIDQISVDDDLWQLGLDSLGAIEFTEILVQRCDGGISPNDFLGASTPAAVAAVIDGALATSRGKPFEFFPDPTTAPIFTVCGAGSTALTLRHLATALSRTPEGRQPVVVFEQFGRFEGWGRDRTVGAAAQRNLEYLQARQPEGPYILVGHSWGGLVAHEMSVRLSAAGHRVRLVVLDTAIPANDRQPWWSPLRRGAMTTWPRQMAKRGYWALVRVLPPLERVIPLGSRSDHFFHRGLAAGHRHRPSVFGGPMLVVEAGGSNCGSTWLAEPQREVVECAGDHNSLLQPPHVGSVAGAITAFINHH